LWSLVEAQVLKHAAVPVQARFPEEAYFGSKTERAEGSDKENEVLY